MIELSDPQKEGLRQIKKLNAWMIGTFNITEKQCWFNQTALNRVTFHTLQALRTKGFLASVYNDDYGYYYRYTGEE